MAWNAEWYENKHGFVVEYGRDKLSCVPENPDQSILDLGCGTDTLDARLMPWRNRFDIVFSNAAFHWIPDHGTLLNAVSRILKPQGKQVCEFGEPASIFSASGKLSGQPWNAGTSRTQRIFTFLMRKNTAVCWNRLVSPPETMQELDRPTPLKDGSDGLRNWAVQFFREDLKNLHEEQRIQIFKEMEDSLKDELWDGSQWVADYRRIRVTAAR